MCGSGKGGHVGAGLGDDDVGDRPAHPRDASEQVPRGLHGVDLLLDPLPEVLDCRVVLVDSVEQKSGHEGMVLGETAG